MMKRGGGEERGGLRKGWEGLIGQREGGGEGEAVYIVLEKNRVRLGCGGHLSTLKV